MTKRLTISECSYRPILVWDGERHDVWIRVVDDAEDDDTRWRAQRAIQNAASFRALRRFNKAASRKPRGHRFRIGQRWRARRFLVDIEPLIRARLVAVKFDGELIALERQPTSRTKAKARRRALSVADGGRITRARENRASVRRR